MSFRSLAGVVGAWLVLGTTSCSGSGASFESGGDGGTSPGGSGTQGGSTAKAGSGASGGSSSPEAGSTSGGTSTGGTSNPDQPNCDVAFDELDRSCGGVDDCVLVQHQLNCCGTILIMGLTASERPAFNALEQYCSAQFPACGCAAQGMQLEDGSIIEFGSTAAQVECVEGQCRSRNSGSTTPCGEQACTEDQYCYQFVGGPAGSEPSYNCMPLGDCQDCECLNLVGCQCTDTGGAIQVFCAAP